MTPQRQRRKSNASPGTTGSARRQAAQRGYAFERWFAAHNDGEVWPGQDGDVDAHGYRIECKLRSNLAAYGELAHHIEQASKNSESSGKPWVLALTGGREYKNYAVYALVSFDEWDRLSRLEDNLKALKPFLDKQDPWPIVSVWQTLAFEMAEKMNARQRDDNSDIGGETAG